MAPVHDASTVAKWRHLGKQTGGDKRYAERYRAQIMRSQIRIHIAFACLGLSFLVAGVGHTKPGLSAWLEREIWPMAQSKSVSRATFDLAFDGVKFDRDLPGLTTGAQSHLQHQPEFRSPGAYFSARSLAELTRMGRIKAARHARFLKQLENLTGVPGRIVLAIWGQESRYGAVPLRHDVFQVLATRAFDNPASHYFRAQLLSALQILDSGAASRKMMKSNWAGAMGQPQFMPDSYLRFATDGDGDGRVDIWQSERDTLASIAHYLAKNGWVSGRDWGFEVSVPPSVSCNLEGPDQGRPIREWADMGIRRVSGNPFPAHEAGAVGYLMMPAGRRGPAFIVTPNFYVLKTYNESDLYALLVGHLGDRVAYGMGDFVGRWRPTEHLLKRQITRMQRHLVAAGHDVGGIDGLVGFKTRRSIGLWQSANGMRQTCFPDRNVLRTLR